MQRAMMGGVLYGKRRITSKKKSVSASDMNRGYQSSEVKWLNSWCGIRGLGVNAGISDALA